MMGDPCHIALQLSCLHVHLLQSTTQKTQWVGEGDWGDGVVKQIFGPVTHLVEVKGELMKRHIDQLLSDKDKR